MKTLQLLGGITPAQFLAEYWHKKPLLIRQAVPGMQPLLSVEQLAELATKDYVESRLITMQDGQWDMQQGPLPVLPPRSQRAWTMLVQGANLYDAAADALLRQFRFVPDARLDDLMISFATDGGGVGPHFDSYDVFLMQVHGQRRWRISQQKDLTLRDGVPLKILANFKAEEEFVLEPGDMLYLPPRYAHDGIAIGECMTYSVGFRAPARAELARELLLRLADGADDAAATATAMYRDATQAAVANPGAMPEALAQFAHDAVTAALRDPKALARALGEYLTEPKANVWFEPGRAPLALREVRLDRRSRMQYDADHVFINGEAVRAGGRDATLMRRLADDRCLGPKDMARASAAARDLLSSWCDVGWVHGT